MRVGEILAQRPILERVVLPLLCLREQFMFLKMTRDNEIAKRLTTVPGVGPITA